MIQWVVKNHAKSNEMLESNKKHVKNHVKRNLRIRRSIWQKPPGWSIFEDHNAPAQSSSLHFVEGDKVPVVHVKSMLGKAVWVLPASRKGKPLCGTVFAQGPGCTWWVMQKDGDVQCVPQGNLTLGECSQ